jgi:hypothetical protein
VKGGIEEERKGAIMLIFKGESGWTERSHLTVDLVAVME